MTINNIIYETTSSSSSSDSEEREQFLGIKVAGAFNHLLPDANENFLNYFERVDPNNQYKEFPFGPTLAIFVMFMLITLDKLVVERGVTGEAGHNHMNMSASISTFSEAASTPTPNPENETTILISTGDSGITLSSYQGLNEHGHGHHHNSGINNGKSHQSNVSQATIFMIALSVHSIFDGLGLGAETNPNDFYGLLVAVIAHKALDGFALGVPVFYAKFSTVQTALSLTFCAAMTPLGIGIGMGLSNYFDGNGAILTEAIVLSITTGSFLYISLIELLPSGLGEPGWLKVKLGLTFLGWTLLALLALWV
ncbi:zinc/iron permease [Heterostelium album PN500]|uniref:Zinc/iron permease n=1 Tax=Heterostelium pallidum (strain ATCC 26659 / Pp 5 / PN500) TaxID=670386 RepID=D3BJH1_HETP5|nr:zinc/iron permease [Heterostelium album PN500]EFA78051.1 zinc/iron permease [Heterostelium album PN500]|eukprot:XP_020430178.1 zinc/iron permease [Heterostelium album PN500]